MRALVLDQEKQLSIKDVDQPTPQSGEVLIRLKAAALNHRDIWITKGLYPGMTLPCILGSDGAGIVEKLGKDVESSWLDKEVMIYPAHSWGNDEAAASRSFRVLGMPDSGTFAQYICVSVDHLVEKPKHLSWKAAAAIPLTFLTAWRGLNYHGQINADKSVLITGIGGGVAQAALAIADTLGATVYVTSSNESKIDAAIDDGAEGGLNYKDANWYTQLKEVSGGIDVVLDSSPSENLDDYLQFLNYGAKIIAYGATASRKASFNISKFFLRHIQFIGTAMGSVRQFGEVVEFIAKHKIEPQIDSVFTLDEAEKAIHYLEEGNQIGKVVLEIQ